MAIVRDVSIDWHHLLRFIKWLTSCPLLFTLPMDRLRSSKLLYHNALSGLKIDFVDNVRSLWGGLLHKVVDESHSITGIYSCIIFCLQNFVSICWVSTILSSKPRYLKNNVNGTLEWRTGLYKHPQHRLPSYSIKSLSILHHLLFHSLSYLSYTTLSSLSFAIFPVLHFLIFPFLHCSILSFSSTEYSAILSQKLLRTS